MKSSVKNCTPDQCAPWRSGLMVRLAANRPGKLQIANFLPRGKLRSLASIL